MSTRKSQARWQGALEGLHEGQLYGWAVDAADPAARVVVEICLNDEAFSCVIADVFRSDCVGARRGRDGCHGFVVDLGALQHVDRGVLSARIANTGVGLSGHISLARPAVPPATALSHVFGDGGLRIFGWAVDPVDAKRPVRVSAWEGSTRLGEAMADQYHPAIRGHHDGPHGFEIALPLALADGKPHEIRVVDDAGRPLNHSPLIVCTLAADPRGLLREVAHGPAAALLDIALDSYQVLLPRGVGMSQFPAWQARFETAPDLPRRKSAVAVIVHGAGDATATLRSLRAQQGATAHPLSADAPSGFAAALRRALALRVQAIACVRAGDTLPPHALACAAAGLQGEARIAYTDSQLALPGAEPVPWFKPAWNPEYAWATDHPLELMLIDAAWLRGVLEGHMLPDDAARLGWGALAARHGTWDRAIVHVPRCLYAFHTPLADAERAARLAAARAALKFLEPASRLLPLRAGEGSATVPETSPHHAQPADHTPRRLLRAAPRPDAGTRVTLIIPTRDQAELLARCIASLQQRPDRPGLDILVVDNGSVEPATQALFRRLKQQGVRILAQPGPFNFARLNNRAVAAAKGTIVGLINNDIEALHDGWLDEILAHLARPGVGAVGAKLLWPNGMVQHGGVVLGIGNVVGHYGNLLADADAGDHHRNQVVQQVSAVTAACLFLRRADYLALGGMDEAAFPVAFNDVNLCLRLRHQGKAIVWTPFAKLLHAESASRGREDTPQKIARARREIEQLRQRWGGALLADPAYHPSLNLDVRNSTFTGLALPPRDRSPRGPGLAR